MASLGADILYHRHFYSSLEYRVFTVLYCTVEITESFLKPIIFPLIFGKMISFADSFKINIFIMQTYIL